MQSSPFIDVAAINYHPHSTVLADGTIGLVPHKANSGSVIVSKEREWCRQFPPDTERVHRKDESPESTI